MYWLGGLGVVVIYLGLNFSQLSPWFVGIWNYDKIKVWFDLTVLTGMSEMGINLKIRLHVP